MNFRDRYETDEEGNQFLFTVEMQRRLSEAGLPVEVAYLDQVQQAPPPPKPKPSPAPSQEKKRSKEDVTEPVSIQIDPMTGKYIGRIKWYNARKGYGFILRGGGEEIFFHRSAAGDDADAMAEGLWILYDVEETNKGPEATDIEPYEGDALE
ncbi:MAG: cold shock domain-containing protein [Anaerolineaceae bacterium]|nr:MAG: cold shock domain-containing protein [Anaerolineaceae bacterium]